MNELLGRILDAHGGMDRWNGYKKVDATIASGGGLFPLKGVPQDPSPRRMTAWLHEERSSVSPYGAPDQRTMFTPDRIAIEKLDGAVVAERRAPKDSFAGHQMNTPWDAPLPCSGLLMPALTNLDQPTQSPASPTCWPGPLNAAIQIQMT